MSTSQRKPGFVKIKKGENEMYMPNLMSLKYRCNKAVIKSQTIQDKANREENEDKKNEKILEAQDLLFDAIDLIIEDYPEYKNFSENFSMMDHIKTIRALMEGIREIELKEEMEESFLVSDEEDRTIAKDSKSFL